MRSRSLQDASQTGTTVPVTLYLCSLTLTLPTLVGRSGSEDRGSRRTIGLGCDGLQCRHKVWQTHRPAPWLRGRLELRSVRAKICKQSKCLASHLSTEEHLDQFPYRTLPRQRVDKVFISAYFCFNNKKTIFSFISFIHFMFHSVHIISFFVLLTLNVTVPRYIIKLWT